MRVVSRLVVPVVEAPAVVHGALWMVGAGLCFAVMTGLIRYVSGGLHPFEIVFFRNLFGLAALTPWFLRVGRTGLATRRRPLHFWRGIVGLVAMLAWFYAISAIPLAEAVALTFTAPLFATVGAVLVLGEVVRLRRLTAILFGFVGAMIILRPGLGNISLGTGMALLSAVAMANSVIIVKLLSRTETTPTIVAWGQLIVLPLSVVPAVLVWRWPDPMDLVWLALIGVLATLGHLAVTRSFTVADTTAVMPYDFLRLVFTAIIGFALFGERPDGWTLVGAGVIFLSSFYVARREARLARSRRAP